MISNYHLDAAKNLSKDANILHSPAFVKFSEENSMQEIQSEEQAVLESLEQEVEVYYTNVN